MTLEALETTAATHHTAEPPILYFGTPVALISTRNPDGSANLAPMSSVWWLGWRCMLGLAGASRTTENLLRAGEGVVNLPSADLAPAVDRLARTTGSDPVPAGKVAKGYRHEAAKFDLAGLTPVASQTVDPPRAGECPVQLEVVVAGRHDVGADDPEVAGRAVAIEARVTRVHLDSSITADGEPDRVDPDRWRPLIMSFQRFYGLTDHEVAPSELARIPETLYRTPDLDRARSGR